MHYANWVWPTDQRGRLTCWQAARLPHGERYIGDQRAFTKFLTSTFYYGSLTQLCQFALLLNTWLAGNSFIIYIFCMCNLALGECGIWRYTVMSIMSVLNYAEFIPPKALGRHEHIVYVLVRLVICHALFTHIVYILVRLIMRDMSGIIHAL